MLTPFDPKLQQSMRAADLAVCWKLAAGRALSLRARSDAVLQLRQGQAWVTLNERPRGHGQDGGDHFIGPGQQLPVRAGRHLVMESLDRAPVHFEWLPAQAAARSTRSHGAAAVAQPLGDLLQAVSFAGDALLRLLVGCGGYLLTGLLPFRRR